ncbi:MAG: hypothetical protein Q9168_008290 [Polycauliona sp. 1 TL-2023]
MLRGLLTRSFCNKRFIFRPSPVRLLNVPYHSHFQPVRQQSSTMTSTPVKLPAGRHWRNEPKWLEDCEDEFMWAYTGEEQDANGAVKPLLYLHDGSCSYLVEYPTNSRQYYMFNSVSSEIFRIQEPTKLDDIIEELGKPKRKGIKMESLWGENGTRFVDLDELEPQSGKGQ